MERKHDYSPRLGTFEDYTSTVFSYLAMKRVIYIVWTEPFYRQSLQLIVNIDLQAACVSIMEGEFQGFLVTQCQQAVANFLLVAVQVQYLVIKPGPPTRAKQDLDTHLNCTEDYFTCSLSKLSTITSSVRLLLNQNIYLPQLALPQP